MKNRIRRIEKQVAPLDSIGKEGAIEAIFQFYVTGDKSHLEGVKNPSATIILKAHLRAKEHERIHGAGSAVVLDHIRRQLQKDRKKGPLESPQKRVMCQTTSGS